jgi:lipopolysaccharide transport system permease protein
MSQPGWRARRAADPAPGSSTSPASQLTTVVRPYSPWQALDLHELWRFRDLLTVLAWRDVKLRYRQTALGAIWVLLQPVLAAAIFTFVFSKVAGLPSDGVPYFLFAYAGVLGWNVFQSTIIKASGSLLADAPLISKIYFPRIILPLATAVSTLIDFGIGLAVMLILAVAQGRYPTPALLLLPFWLCLTLLLAVGLGFFAGAMLVSYRDVQYALPVAVQFLLYATPVAYAASAVPGHLLQIYYLNPLAAVLEGFRWSLLGAGRVPWPHVAYAGLVATAVFIGGALTFSSLARGFADVV